MAEPKENSTPRPEDLEAAAAAKEALEGETDPPEAEQIARSAEEGKSSVNPDEAAANEAAVDQAAQSTGGGN